MIEAMTLTSLLATARTGRIHMLRGVHAFTPVVAILQREFARALAIDDVAKEWDSLSWERASAGLQALSQRLERDPAHLAAFARVMLDAGVDGESLLEIPLAKSLRASLAGRGRSNYGYQVHRDSWFDLSPDGINIVLYMTDVPYHGNTRFYPEFFGIDLAWNRSQRSLLDEEPLRMVTAWECRAGDCLLFSGDQLHGGALADVSRLSVEFRVSRTPSYGRPQQGIRYRSLGELVR